METPLPTPELTESNFSEVQIAMGRSHERTGNLAAAEAAYRAAIRNNGENAVALHRLALVTEKLGRGEEAEKLLLRAAALSPDNAQIRSDLGYWYALREQWPEARRHFEHAIKLDPSLDRAHNNLGMLLARTGDAPKALRHFEAAGLTAAEARSNLGLAHLNRQEFDHAQKQLDMALTSDPKLPQAVRLASALRQSSAAQPQPAITPSATQDASPTRIASLPVADAVIAAPPSTVVTPVAPRIEDPFEEGAELPDEGAQPSHTDSVVAASATRVATPTIITLPPVTEAPTAAPPAADPFDDDVQLPSRGKQQPQAALHDLAVLLVASEESAPVGSELAIVAPERPQAEAARATYEVGAPQGSPGASSLIVR